MADNRVDGWTKDKGEYFNNNTAAYTVITYLYRDSNNNKVANSVAFSGIASDAEMEALSSSLVPDDWKQDGCFIPSRVGLEDLQFMFDDDDVGDGLEIDEMRAQDQLFHELVDVEFADAQHLIGAIQDERHISEFVKEFSAMNQSVNCHVEIGGLGQTL